MKKPNFRVPTLVLSVLAIALALTSCSAVFDSAISGTVKDRNASSQTGGIADVMVYAYDDKTAWENAYNSWDKKSVFSDSSVPSAKTTTDGSFSISSLRWKTNNPVYGKDADCKTIYLLAFHKDYGLVKVDGRTVQSDKSNNFGIVYCEKVTETKNLVIKFKDKEDNSTTASGSDSTITNTTGFSFRYSYNDGYSADDEDNVGNTVTEITNGEYTLAVKYKKYNEDGSEAVAPTVTISEIQSGTDWSYEGAKTVSMAYSSTDKTYTNNSLYFTNDWKTVAVTVNLKDGSSSNLSAVTDPIYFTWKYNNGDGEIKSDNITTTTGSATINVKFKKGMESPCILTLEKFDDSDNDADDKWTWTTSEDDATEIGSDGKIEITMKEDKDTVNQSVYFKKNYLRIPSTGITGYFISDSGTTKASGYGYTNDFGDSIDIYNGENKLNSSSATTRQEVLSNASNNPVTNYGRFEGLIAGTKLKLMYTGTSYEGTTEELTIKGSIRGTSTIKEYPVSFNSKTTDFEQMLIK